MEISFPTEFTVSFYLHVVSCDISTNQVFHSRENEAFDIQMRRHFTGSVSKGIIHGEEGWIGIDKAITENVFLELSSLITEITLVSEICIRRL